MKKKCHLIQNEIAEQDGATPLFITIDGETGISDCTWQKFHDALVSGVIPVIFTPNYIGTGGEVAYGYSCTDTGGVGSNEYYATFIYVDDFTDSGCTMAAYSLAADNADGYLHF